MVMDYALWKETLFKVNNNKNLEKGSVINKVKDALRHGRHGYLEYQEYLPWEKANFDINHQFEVENSISIEHEGSRFIGHISTSSQPESNRLTLLHLAARINLGNIANALLGVEKINVNALDEHGWTPLHVASLSGHIDIVNALIGEGTKINIDASDEDGWTSLHWAVRNGRANVVNALIANHANANAVDNKASTPLHWAILCGHTPATHLATKNDYIGIVKVLLKNKANVNAADENEYTPLHWAAKLGYTEIINILIENGANPLLKNEDGKTPGDLARYGNIKKLLEKAEEEQLKKLNEEKNNLTQDKDDNKDTTPLLEETEKKQPTSAIKKGLFASGAVAVLGTAVAVALFATGTVAVELIPIVIAVVAIAAAALAVGGITYMMLKPSTEMDEVEEEQGITEDGRRKV